MIRRRSSPSDTPRASARIERLEALVRRLRGPDGCPWDREQTLPDMRSYLLEEAHEAASALDEDDPRALCSELGDLLFQIVFICHLGAELGRFTLTDVIDGIETKMIARHPHVFGDQTADDAAQVVREWESRKRRESGGSVLQGVPTSLPALVAAYRMGQKAAGLGFDWPGPEAVIDKLEEELRELVQVQSDDRMGSEDERRERAREELGDLFFTLVNLSRHLGIDPEAATAAANRKFRRRFAYVEQRLDPARTATLAEMEELWQQAKAQEDPGEPDAG